MKSGLNKGYRLPATGNRQPIPPRMQAGSLGWVIWLLVPLFALAFQADRILPASINEITIPLKNAGRLLVVEATVDNVHGNLIFDTGASEIVLNRTYFRDHVRAGKLTSQGITGGVNAAERVNIGRLNIGPLSYETITASLADLGHIENQRGIKVLGLMNLGLIKDFEILIDASRNELKLFRIDKEGNRVIQALNATKYDCIQEMIISGDILFVKGEVNGKQLKLCFDTGAEICALSVTVPKQVMNSVTIERKIDLRGAGTAKKEILYGKLREMSINGYKIRDVETIVTSMESLSEAYGTGLDGILGYNFLTGGIISINFVRKEFAMKFVNQEAE